MFAALQLQVSCFLPLCGLWRCVRLDGRRQAATRLQQLRRSRGDFTRCASIPVPLYRTTAGTSELDKALLPLVVGPPKLIPPPLHTYSPLDALFLLATFTYHDHVSHSTRPPPHHFPPSLPALTSSRDAHHSHIGHQRQRIRLGLLVFHAPRGGCQRGQVQLAPFGG